MKEGGMLVKAELVSLMCDRNRHQDICCQQWGQHMWKDIKLAKVTGKRKGRK